MKTITIFALLLIAGLLKVQQSDLMANTWYLQKMIGSNGTETAAPHNSEVSNIPATFNQTDMWTAVVTSFLGWVFPGAPEPITNTTLHYDEYQYAPYYPDCILPENCIFQSNYFSFFGYGFPMNYQITNENDYLKLTLTNKNGTQAVYYSENLAVSDIEKKEFKVYPNPVKNSLTILTRVPEVRIKLYDMQGRLILDKKGKQNAISNTIELEMNSVKTGNYIITIGDANGTVIHTTKITKE